MYQIRTIKTEADYAVALARVEALWEAAADTDEADELDVLSLLIERYEDELFPTRFPSPVAAIRFRMEQDGLENKDLVPYVGNLNRVSEVLNGKRQLTLSMIRALHENLGIPADVLIQEAGRILPARLEGVDWNRFPVVEMAKRGWVKARKNLKEHAEDIMRAMIERAGGMDGASASLRKKTDSTRRNAKMDSYALHAWCLHVMITGRSAALAGTYDPKAITLDFITSVIRLSPREDGPVAAQKLLAERGIALVVAKHLPRTHLDGAVMMAPEGHPIIGMTLRHDRLDNFWYCLAHELAHAGRHLQSAPDTVIIDDLELSSRDDDVKEREADEWATEATVPTRRWESHTVSKTASVHDVVALAHSLGVSPAIVAGRARRMSGDYRQLSGLVGQQQLRKHFPEWK